MTGWLAGTLHIPPLLFSLFSAHYRTLHTEMQKVRNVSDVLQILYRALFRHFESGGLHSAILPCFYIYGSCTVCFAVCVARCSQVIDNGLWLNNNKDLLIGSPVRWFQCGVNYSDIFIILIRLVSIQ